MKKILCFSIAMLITCVAHARMPVLAASCPDNLNVDTNEKGVVYINGKKAKVKKFNENYFEAKGAGATISISRFRSYSQLHWQAWSQWDLQHYGN